MPAAEFVPLADVVLCRGATALHASDAASPVPEKAACEPEMPSRTRDDAAAITVLRDARLFRARLADAFDEALPRLLREIAANVLARELRLAPCDLVALVRQTIDRAPCVRVRVAPEDAGFTCEVPVVADAALDPGDAIVELAHGSFDARLGVRIATVLEAFA